MEDQTLTGILASAAAAFPSRPALSVPGRLSLTHSQLLHLVDSAAASLAGIGVRPGDVIALAFPNTPDFVIALLAVIRARAVAAPLDPAYTQDEFDFYLSDSEATLLLTNPEGNPASRAAAANLHIRHATTSLINDELILHLPHATASLINDELIASVLAFEPELATLTPNIPSDVALFLDTSGTTSRPKGVPLTQLNLAASVNNIKSAYRLSSTDSTVIVLPLFHVHGLIDGLLSSLAAGAAVSLEATGEV